MSGGVDSSVAALRLIKQGYDVTGVFIKVWHPSFMACNWEEERIDAMRVAAHLGIPFLTCDAEVAYRDEVAQYFIDSYQRGITPNPDVMCNKAVKFGVFLNFALEHGADYIATGHYVRKVTHGRKEILQRGLDPEKDQSYFLWMLNQRQIRQVIFPVGDSKKEVIRQEAIAAGLPTAQKKDSQGVCFLGHVDIPEFLSHYIDLEPGPVQDESGAVIGEHQGVFVYTLGQRHGFTIHKPTETRQPYYVVAKNIDTNTLIVGQEPPTIKAETAIKIQGTVLHYEPQPDVVYYAQFRYRQTPIPVRIMVTESNEVFLSLETVAERPANGQSCVLYDGDMCIGGGIIAM